MATTSKKTQKKRKSAAKKQQGGLVFALDIGTRSIIGIVGKVEGDLFNVLAIESEEHTRRSMKDGQIENIDQVAEVAQKVKKRLEDKLGVNLKKVCIAAAGRTLRTQKASYEIQLEKIQSIDKEIINQLEIGAVSAAEDAFHKEKSAGDEEHERGFLLVGYSVLSYYLDNFNISSLKDHKGKNLRADVIATFLPSEVVDSLYMTMNKCNLEVVSLTLEPIAAINAAIPQDLRLLNLALIDIGAGTSDIAVCRDGGITGYTMATVAGDEITETLMKHYLLDFSTAEKLKMSYMDNEIFTFTNILGMEETVERDDVCSLLKEPIYNLSKEIVRCVEEINNGVPSAVFLAGGGSKLAGLKEAVSEHFNMENRRVAIAGGNFKMSAFSNKYDLNNPEYATPLGIAVSAGLNLIHDSRQIFLNNKPAKIFKSGTLRVIDILMMNGYGYSHILGHSGKSVTVSFEGQKKVFYGGRAIPATLKVNGADASISDVVKAGDKVEFVPAVSGKDAEPSAAELLPEDLNVEELEGWELYVNGIPALQQTILKNGDEVSLIIAEKVQEPEAERPETEEIQPQTQVTEEKHFLNITLNDKSMALPPKDTGGPYYLMDLLEFSEIDFDNLDTSVVLCVNGEDSNFLREIKNNDIVEIR